MSIVVIAPYGTAILMGIVGFRYSYLILKGRMRPVLATWLLFSLTVGLSLLTYFSSEGSTVTANMVNIMDVFMCWSLLLVLVFTRDKNATYFSNFDKYCFMASGAIFMFWVLTWQHELSNILLQLIITIAYLPTLARLWKANKHSESFGMWGMIWTATALGLFSAMQQSNLLGIIYAARGLFLISALLLLMVRIERKKLIKSNI